ncbi:hypothetical protein GGS21DRAFT_299343 [Xylaria nigripes]|nr:hypothetical protein GGS21DRAFT_299343 [Xylaria nigripes]
MSMADQPLFEGAQWEDPQEYIDDVVVFTNEAYIMRESDPEQRDIKMQSVFRKGLRGDAKDWYQQLPAEKRQNWSELQSGLKRRFPRRAGGVSNNSDEDSDVERDKAPPTDIINIDSPSSPGPSNHGHETSWDYSKEGTIEEKQKAIKEEAFRISPLEEPPREEPVKTKLTNEDMMRIEMLIRPGSNLPIYTTVLTPMEGNIEPPRSEFVDIVLKHLENANLNMLCAPLPAAVARQFVSRQKTQNHLFPPSTPVIIIYNKEVDYFHVPWMLLYFIVQVEFTIGHPAFFNQHFLREFLSFPQLIPPVIPESNPEKEEECIITSRPQAWSAVTYKLDMFRSSTFRRRHKWTGKQAQSFITTATRLIRQEFPVCVREEIALRIRFCHPDEYPSQVASAISLRSAMREGSLLSLSDFEVVRCMNLGDLSCKMMSGCVDYLRRHGQGWFLDDKLIASLNKDTIYSPTGSPAILSFGQPIPTTTRRVTQMLDSFGRGYGFALHAEGESTKRKLAENSSEGNHKRVTRGRKASAKRKVTEDSSDGRHKRVTRGRKPSATGVDNENTKLKHQVKTLTTEKERLLRRISELEKQAQDLASDQTQKVSSQESELTLKERESLVVQLEEVKGRNQDLAKQNEELHRQLQKEKDNTIQALQSHISQITTMLPAYQNIRANQN